MAQQRPPPPIHKRRAPLGDPPAQGSPLLQLRLEVHPRLLLLRRDAVNIVIGVDGRLALMALAARDEVHGWDFQDVGAAALGAGLGRHGALLRVAEVVGGFGVCGGRLVI